MDINKEYKYYKYGELAYKKAFKLYQFIYFSWKRRTDRDKIKLFKEYIKPGMTVVDIGANIGFYSRIFGKLVGEKGKLHCFEPDKLNFKHLVSNTRKYKNIVVNNAAVSDKSSKIKLYRYPLNVEFKTYDMMGESKDYTEIDGVSLDDYFKNGETVDVVKTDTEGYDYFVIKGMKEVVKRSKNMILISEFWPFMLDKSGVTPEQFLTQLKEMGFDVKFTEPLEDISFEQMIKDRFIYTDVLAVKKSI